jgi:hypothetical protein
VQSDFRFGPTLGIPFDDRFMTVTAGARSGLLLDAAHT